MASAESWPASEGLTAAAVINDAVETQHAPEELLSDLQRKKELLEGEERQLIARYIIGIRPAIQGVLVEPLDLGVGGQCDSSDITIAQSTLLVASSIDHTIAQAQETRRHEDYHDGHDHTEPIVAGASAKGETVATIGGHAFTETALIEGLTVARTGQEFVSQEYVRFAGEVRSAVAAAGIGLDELEEAVDQKDLRLVDDMSRMQGSREAYQALAG